MRNKHSRKILGVSPSSGSYVAAILVSLALVALNSQAAVITWGAATNTTAVTNVSTTGTLVEASNGGAGSPTVNTVTFTSRNFFDAFANDNAPGMLNSGTTGDANFNTLLLNVHFTTDLTADGTIQLGRYVPLTLGLTYEVQVFFMDQRTGNGGRLLRVGDGNGNNVDLLANPGGTIESPFGQYAIGTFVAGGDTQSLQIQSTNFPNIHLNAYQVRLIPEPSAALLGGLGMLGLLVRRRR